MNPSCAFGRTSLGVFLSLLACAAMFADGTVKTSPRWLTPSTTPADSSKTVTAAKDEQAWETLTQAEEVVTKDSGTLPTEASARAQARSARVTKHNSVADQAQAFYTEYPDSYWAGEARKLEISALLQAVDNGDESGTVRLKKAVAALRSSTKVTNKVKAEGVATYAFATALAEAKSNAARLTAAETVARDLIKEFPSEQPGYQTLYVLAKASDSTTALKLAKELVASAAPTTIKTGAQTIIDRYALVGKTLSSVVGETGAALLATMRQDESAIVYSWATWGAGSLELGRMIQARRFNALGICVDEDVTAAKAAQQSANLGGVHLYDASGLKGTVASNLKFITAGTIYLVDAKGVIRDVQGATDLETKLTTWGLKSAAIVVPTITK